MAELDFDRALAERGLYGGASLDKLYRRMQRALVSNPLDLPTYGSGPSAGLTAPTLSWLTANAALTAKPQRRAMNDAAGNDFAAFYGGIPTPASGSSYGFPIVSASVGIPTGATKAAVGYAVEAITDDAAPIFEVGFNGTGQWRCLVDDQFLAGSTVNGVVIADRAPSIMANVNGGGPQGLQLNFGSVSAKGRKVRFEAELQMLFRGILVGNDSAVWRPTPLDFTRVVFLADSFVATPTENNNADSNAHDNAGALTGKLIGAHDTVQLAVAGTGITVDSALGKRFGSVERMSDLAAVAALPGGISMLVIPLSINDRLADPALVAQGLLAVIQQARAIVGPSVPIGILGASSGSYGPAALAPMEEAVAVALPTLRDSFVGFAPMSTRKPVPLLTGTEDRGNATGAGTAGRYIRNDKTHPFFAPLKLGGGIGGMEYHARAWAQGLHNIVNAMRR